MLLVVLTAERLLDEARRLSHALRRWDSVRRQGDLTAAMRTVLELLLFDGPAAVPALARAAGASRQHVQQQVDALLAEGRVERRNNPSHRRSSLIALTDSGRALIQTVRSEELRALSRLQPGVSDDAIADATQALASLREALLRDADRGPV